MTLIVPRRKVSVAVFQTTTGRKILMERLIKRIKEERNLIYVFVYAHDDNDLRQACVFLDYIANTGNTSLVMPVFPRRIESSKMTSF